MEILALLFVVVLGVVLRIAVPGHHLKFYWYVALSCLLLSIIPILLIAYAVNFDKQFFIWFPIHQYTLVLIAFLMFLVFVGIVIGIAGKGRRVLR
jgi:hypothetical protein